MHTRDGLFLALRYGILILLGLFQLIFFYFIFTPLTVYLVYGILLIFEPMTRLIGHDLFLYHGFYAQIIPACVAGAAYYLLLVLNLSTPMGWRTRMKSICFVLGIFLLLNVLRIVGFIFLFDAGIAYFDQAHRVMWYFGSTILVVLVWFLNVWLFCIQTIPIYSDIHSIVRDIRPRRRKY